MEGECGCPRCWGHTKKKRTCRNAPARHTPPPAALLCLRPARQDAYYGRARWTSALPEPQQPFGCCVQALRDPWGQACWLSGSHTPLRATARTAHWLPCGHIPLRATPRTRPLGAERPQQGEGLGPEPGMHHPRCFGAQRVHGRACREKERTHVGATKRQVGRNFRRANDP